MTTKNENDKRTLVMTRMFNAPRALVYKAFTDAGMLEKWWGPHGFSASGCRISPVPGGEFYIDMIAPDGLVQPVGGRIVEAEEPQKLVFITGVMQNEQGGYDIEGHNTIILEEPEPGKTILTVSVNMFKVPDDSMLEGMDQGWSEAFEKLGAFVEAQ